MNRDEMFKHSKNVPISLLFLTFFFLRDWMYQFRNNTQGSIKMQHTV